MKSPLQITFRDMPHSEAIETAIREKAEKLESFHPDLMTCRVVVALTSKHKHQGHLYNLRLDATVPGHEFVVNRERAQDVYVAIRDSFDDMRRQLEDAVRERRGEVKTHALPRHGEIVRLNAAEGYGFIRTADGSEFYFSAENVVDANLERLDVGTAVQFIEDMSGDTPQAKRVSIGKHHFS